MATLVLVSMLNIMGAFATACNLGQFACSPLTVVSSAVLGANRAVFVAGAVIGLATAVTLVLRSCVDDTA